jgi:hypothetical protein
VSGIHGYVACPKCKGTGRFETPSGWFCDRCKSTGFTLPVPVYVAGPFNEWPTIREAQAEVVSRGGRITFDWTKTIDELPLGTTDGDVSDEWAVEKALHEIDGVIAADAFLLLAYAPSTSGGMWTELGASLCLLRVRYGLHWEEQWDRNTSKPRIAVCGPYGHKSIFARIGRRFDDWRDALPFVLGE